MTRSRLWQVMKVGDPSHDFFLVKSYYTWQNSVCRCTVKVKVPLFSTSSAFLLPWMSQTLPPVVLVNHLAWVNLFVMYKTVQSEKIDNVHVMFISTRPWCSHVEKIGFSIERTCVCCLGDRNCGFCLLLWPRESFESYLISSPCSWNINTFCCFWHELVEICCTFRPSCRFDGLFYTKSHTWHLKNGVLLNFFLFFLAYYLGASSVHPVEGYEGVKFCHILIEETTQKSGLVIVLLLRADVSISWVCVALVPNFEAEFSSNASFLQVRQ